MIILRILQVIPLTIVIILGLVISFIGNIPKICEWLIDNVLEKAFVMLTTRVPSFTFIQQYIVDNEESNIKAQSVRFPTIKFQIWAIDEDQTYIRTVEKMPPKVQEYILEKHPKWISDIRNPIQEIELAIKVS